MIQRDGACISLWQANVPPYVSRSEKVAGKEYDVIVVGGGITGLSTALKLQEAGKKCLLLEARNIGYGTTGGTTAHINTLLDTPYSTIEKKFGKKEASLVATAAVAALALIKSNIQAYSIQCGFEEASAFLFAQNEKEDNELGEISEASVRAGLRLSYQDTIPFPFSFVRAIEVPGQAKFNPLAYVYGLAKAFESLDGEILQECRVTNLDRDGLVELKTEKGSFKGKDIVYATHIPPAVNLLHLRCSPWRSYAMALKLTDENYPKSLAYDMVDPYHYYRSQTVEGINYLIAGGKDHKTGVGENSNHLFTELEATVRKNFNVQEVSYRWSSQYFEPVDGLPYIGHLPGQPENFYVATGFGGNGMTYSQVSAMLLSDLILGNENEWSDLFSPNRLKPIAGFTNFISHNAKVISNFAGRLVHGEKLEELAGLANGEGKIVEFEGEKLAMYKDTYGQLHAVHPVCTHLKCEVKWNNAELSWDCPCHGARYDIDGLVMTGPADAALEKINLAALQP